ncbi:hypothetical protein ACFX2I_009630 [Malus domestica]
MRPLRFCSVNERKRSIHKVYIELGGSNSRTFYNPRVLEPWDVRTMDGWDCFPVAIEDSWSSLIEIALPNPRGCGGLVGCFSLGSLCSYTAPSLQPSPSRLRVGGSHSDFS